MKSIGITDIVPIRVLSNIALRVRRVAAEIAKSKNVPDMDARKISIGRPAVTKNQVQINITLNKLHSAYEWGSGVHRKRGTPEKYLIQPKPGGGKKYLAFYENARGTWDYSRGIPQRHLPDGRGLFEKVMHPGVEPRPFLEPAKRQTRQENLRELRENATKNLKLIIRGMARKI